MKNLIGFALSPRPVVLARILSVVTLIGLLFSPFQGANVQAKSASINPDMASTSVYALGLENPRGLKFGPDGNLYVAEGGLGGTNSTVGQCPQVNDVGPYTGGMTARISKIDRKGNRTTVADHLPSSQTSAAAGSFVSGVADVGFLDGRLYALLTGAGCSHGVPNVPNGVIRVMKDGSWKLVADLSAFQKANPVKNPNNDPKTGDFEPDGTWYSWVVLGNSFYAVEPNHGELDRIAISEDGQKSTISRVIDISASQKHIVPTAVAFLKGSFYVGNLETFPLVQGGAKILRISRSGSIQSSLTGFTNVLGIVPGKSGSLYVLESTVGQPFPTPNSGKILRVDKKGNFSLVVSGLSLPTAMTMGPDGDLYVSNNGFGPIGLQGEIVQVHLQH